MPAIFLSCDTLVPCHCLTPILTTAFLLHLMAMNSVGETSQNKYWSAQTYAIKRVAEYSSFAKQVI